MPFSSSGGDIPGSKEQRTSVLCDSGTARDVGYTEIQSSISDHKRLQNKQDLFRQTEAFIHFKYGQDR